MDDFREWLEGKRDRYDDLALPADYWERSLYTQYFPYEYENSCFTVTELKGLVRNYVKTHP